MKKYRRTRPKSGAHDIFLHFDNSPVHKSFESNDKIKQLGFILLEHPPIPLILLPLTSGYSDLSMKKGKEHIHLLRMN